MYKKNDASFISYSAVKLVCFESLCAKLYHLYLCVYTHRHTRFY